MFDHLMKWVPPSPRMWVVDCTLHTSEFPKFLPIRQKTDRMGDQGQKPWHDIMTPLFTKKIISMTVKKFK